jgi:ribosomal protein S18 acetylase RimI-like enzyme
MIGREGYRVLVAEEDAKLIGYALGTEVDNGPFVACRYGYVGAVYAKAGREGRGTEDALYDGLNAWFKKRGLGVAQVDVLCSEPSAQRLWERRGFEPFLDHLWRDGGPDSGDTRSMSLAIRRVSSSDGEDVIALWKEMMDIHSALDSRLSVAPGWRDKVAGSVRRWLRDDHYSLIVAGGGDGVVGFGLGGVVHKTLGPGPSLHGQVAHLCVGSSWRRRGVGRALFWALRDWFAEGGVPSIHAFVSPLNAVSQRFWRGLGFRDYVSRLWCDLV